MDISHKSMKSTQHRQKLINNKLLTTISKSTILALISLTMTFLTPITMLFGYYTLSTSHNQTMYEAGTCLLAFCSLFDVYTNYICILLSYNCFDKMYVKVCGKCDKKCRAICIEKILNKKKTKGDYKEVSMVSKTSMTSVTMETETHFTSITPPNGGSGNKYLFERHKYEQLDTEYDETTETTRDLNTMPTPYTQETAQFGYDDIPEEDEYEDLDEEETESLKTSIEEENEDENTEGLNDQNTAQNGKLLSL